LACRIEIGLERCFRIGKYPALSLPVALRLLGQGRSAAIEVTGGGGRFAAVARIQDGGDDLGLARAALRDAERSSSSDTWQ